MTTTTDRPHTNGQHDTRKPAWLEMLEDDTVRRLVADQLEGLVDRLALPADNRVGATPIALAADTIASLLQDWVEKARRG